MADNWLNQLFALIKKEGVEMSDCVYVLFILFCKCLANSYNYSSCMAKMIFSNAVRASDGGNL